MASAISFCFLAARAWAPRAVFLSRGNLHKNLVENLCKFVLDKHPEMVYTVDTNKGKR